MLIRDHKMMLDSIQIVNYGQKFLDANALS